MAVKKIEIVIPSGVILNIDSFTPEENYIMLKMGSGYLLEGQNAGAGRTHREICQKLGDSLWDDIGRQPNSLVAEINKTHTPSERTIQSYEERIRILEDQTSKLKRELLKYGVTTE